MDNVQAQQAPQAWRLLLHDILLENPELRKPLAAQLEVQPRAIDRWLAAGSRMKPDDSRIRKLPGLLPGHEAEMLLALQRAYPKAFETPEVEFVLNIPSAFYARILDARADTAKSRVRRVVMNIVYRQMALHVDPHEQGLVILFARCVPEHGVVRYLEIGDDGYGTNQWENPHVVPSPFRVGAGSLCVESVLCGEAVVSPDEEINYTHLIPVLYADDIASYAAFPVSSRGEMAGSLFVASAQSNFFTDDRCKVLEHYAKAFALALRDDEFYSAFDFRPAPDFLSQSVILHTQRLVEDLHLIPSEQRDELLQRVTHLLQEEETNYLE